MFYYYKTDSPYWHEMTSSSLHSNNPSPSTFECEMALMSRPVVSPLPVHTVHGGNVVTTLIGPSETTSCCCVQWSSHPMHASVSFCVIVLVALPCRLFPIQAATMMVAAPPPSESAVASTDEGNNLKFMVTKMTVAVKGTCHR